MTKLISDIKFEGTNDEFVWRSPIVDFETGSKVTVYESQEALFYFNGECVGVLGAGSHILETENIPFLKRLVQKVTGNTSIFHAQVYFVNKVEMELRFGVGDLSYQDPAGPVFTIGCHGQLHLMAEQSRKIVEKLVGMNLALTRAQVEEKFRELLIAEVADRLINTILEQNITITYLSAKRKEVSKALQPILAELYENYGFSLEQFMISGFAIPEDDPEYKRLKRLRADQGLQLSELQLQQQRELMEMQIQTQKMRMEADAMAYKRSTEGYTYETERKFDFLDKMSEHENMGSNMSAEMLQLGAGLGMVGAVGGMMQNTMQAAVQPMAQEVAQAAVQPMTQEVAQAAVQPMAQEVSQPISEDPIEVLTKLKRMLDAGLIEQTEYDAKKQEILSRM